MSTVLRYKRDRAQPGNIFTRQKSAWVRSRAADNRSDPTMFVHPACLQRSAAAERLSTFDNRRIYRSICRSNSRWLTTREIEREGTRDPRGATLLKEREKERGREASPTTRWNVAPVSACRFLFTYRYVALLGDTFRQKMHQATFLPRLNQTRDTSCYRFERKLESFFLPNGDRVRRPVVKNAWKYR